MELSEEEKKAIEYIKEFKNEVLEGVGNKSTMAKNIDILLNLIEKHKKEIEEKHTIIMAGAEKVKALEKGNQSLMDSRKKWKNRYYKQRKEIEALKKITNTYNSYGGNLMNDTRIIICDSRYFLNGTFVNKFVSKNKITKKIKEYQEKAEDVKQKYKGVYAYKDDYLEALAKIEGYQELLEEN